MGKLLGLALLVGSAAVGGTVHLARDRATAPAARIGLERADEPLSPAAAEGPHSEEVRLLLYHLRYGSDLRRREVARELARLGPAAKSAIPELVEFLTHEQNWWGRAHREIVDALVAMNVDVVPLLERQLTCKPMRKQVAWTLARLGPAGLDALVRAVADERVPLKVIERPLVHLGKGAAVPLAALLFAAERPTRERAARLLLDVGKNARPVADEIVRALQTPEFGDRIPLVRLLPLLNDLPAEAVHALASMSEHLPLDENGQRVRAIWSTGKSMGELTREERRFVSGGRRELAPLRVLGELGHSAQAALPVLERIMQSDDPVAAAQAARAHWQISGDALLALGHLLPALREESGGVWSPALNVLAEMGQSAKPAISALLRELESDNFHRSWRAESALSAMGDEALPAVRRWLETTDSLNGVGTDIFVAFEDKLGDAALDRLSEHLGEDLRAAIEERNAPSPWTVALELDRRAPIPELRRMMRDPKLENPDLVVHALRELGRAAAPAVPELIDWLEDDKRRAAAMGLLGDIGPLAAAAVPALERYDDREAIIALWRITGDTRYRDLAFRPDEISENDLWALPRLIEVLNDSGLSWRRDAAQALGRLGAHARPALPDLTRIAADETEDEYLRDHARTAIAAISE